MALPITKDIDYNKGRLSLPLNTETTEGLDSYITEFETKYLEYLLGCNLASIFIDNLDAEGVPSDARFTVIFDALCVDYCDEDYKSQGIRSMLSKFVSWQFLRDQEAESTVNGTFQGVSENAEKIQFKSARWDAIYNEAVSDSLVIQFYICENQDDYPEYKGKSIEYINPRF